LGLSEGRGAEIARRDNLTHWLMSTQVDDDRGGLITVHELHQTIREIGQELSIDDVRFSSVLES
jgi:hypothetical protein